MKRKQEKIVLLHWRCEAWQEDLLPFDEGLYSKLCMEEDEKDGGTLVLWKKLYTVSFIHSNERLYLISFPFSRFSLAPG